VVETSRFQAVVALAFACLVVGCDNQKIAELEPGRATEAEVRVKFGTPENVWEDDNGVRVLEYTRQPEGTTNYQIAIGADGKLIAVKQVLTPENLARIQPGMSELEVRRLAGKPGSIAPYQLSNTFVWEYRYQEHPTQTAMWTVTFDAGSGRVKSTGRSDDPKTLGGK
jgi:outer membrane protein assembly factor BamE (lipoprotein component of BamABCDE complex)